MMSGYNLKQYWAFSRVKIKDIYVSPDQRMLNVILVPDKRYLPVCSNCKNKVMRVHSYHKRVMRDPSKTFIELRYRKLYCPACGIRNEYHDFIAPFSRITKRFSQIVFDLC